MSTQPTTTTANPATTAAGVHQVSSKSPNLRPLVYTDDITSTFSTTPSSPSSETTKYDDPDSYRYNPKRLVMFANVELFRTVVLENLEDSLQEVTTFIVQDALACGDEFKLTSMAKDFLSKYGNHTLLSKKEVYLQLHYKGGWTSAQHQHLNSLITTLKNQYSSLNLVGIHVHFVGGVSELPKFEDWWYLWSGSPQPKTFKHSVCFQDLLAYKKEDIEHFFIYAQFVIIRTFGLFKYQLAPTIHGPAKLLQARSDLSLEESCKLMDVVPLILQDKIVIGFSTTCTEYVCVEDSSYDIATNVRSIRRSQFYYRLQTTPNIQERYTMFNDRHLGAFSMFDKQNKCLYAMESAETVWQKLNYFIDRVSRLGGVAVENPVWDMPLNHSQSIYQRICQWKKSRGWVCSPYLDVWQQPHYTLSAKRNEQQDQEPLPSTHSKRQRTDNVECGNKTCEDGNGDDSDHTMIFPMEEI